MSSQHISKINYKKQVIYIEHLKHAKSCITNILQVNAMLTSYITQRMRNLKK